MDVLATQIQKGVIQDIAGLGHLNGGVGPLATCLAHGSKERTRRDYVLASAELMPFIQGIERLEGAGYDVHAPLILTIQQCQQNMRVQSLVKLAPYAPPPNTVRAKWRDAVSERAEQAFVQVQDDLSFLLSTGLVDQFWAVWSDALNEAFIGASELPPSEVEKLPVKGAPVLKALDLAQTWKVMGPRDPLNEGHALSLQASASVKQANRLRFIADSLKRLREGTFSGWPIPAQRAWRKAQAT